MPEMLENFHRGDIWTSRHVKSLSLVRHGVQKGKMQSLCPTRRIQKVNEFTLVVLRGLCLRVMSHEGSS